MNEVFFKRRMVWMPTWRSILLFGLVLCAGVFVFLTNIYGFLAVSKRVTTDVLVVEGWLPKWALKEVHNEFVTGKYKYVITTGGPITSGWATGMGETYAEIAQKALEQLGVPKEKIVCVNAPTTPKQRTLISAEAVQAWVKQNEPSLKSFNVFSHGSHARRSRLLFQQAFSEDSVEIGIIAAADQSFDPTRWWKSSQGLKEVLGETVGYLRSLL